ncbi:hypothetical protein [Sphingomonas solaris]|uniref:Uncharacterized protein n=1 Tax=Alterirhizorhabdus solaris TaxID=2529389 RepID=A0A558QWL2_9SPHN|nr:hypothetical protein [Sphingomonas solaris]TVV71479.1 hypothetical protein FOY91_16725 [Sphingomonas solaris]
MRLVTPLRLVPGVVGLWVVARVAIVMPDLLTPPAEADLPRTAGTFTTATRSGGRVRAMAPERPRSTASADISDGGAASATSGNAVRPERSAIRPSFRTGGGAGLRLSPAGIIAPATPAPSTPADAAPAMAATGSPAASSTRSVPVAPFGGALVGVAPATAAPAGSRWSGGAYLFRRGEGGSPALATGGQLGGSQAGARVAWRLDPADRFAVVARASTPLRETRGAEVAAGVDWHPLPGRPLRVSVERRVDVGGAGRDAWSAYAAGGFWRPIGRGVVGDGYAQAGVVGARRRDLFADGALRAGYRRELGAGRSLTVGGGAWGAAQPGVARLDVGPRVALGLPLAGTSVTAAAEWRVRVAGDAAPGTGLAITLAADF